MESWRQYNAVTFIQFSSLPWQAFFTINNCIPYMGGEGGGKVERDQISDIRPPKIKYQTPPPPQSNIRYHALAKKSNI